jgi:hypothetical protein
MTETGEPDDQTAEPTARGEAPRPGRHGHELQRSGHQTADEGRTKDVSAAPGRALRRRPEPGYRDP